MPSRSPSDLTDACRYRYEKLGSALNALGIAFLCTCTMRSNAEQQKMYDQGRITPGKIVTNAKPGQSMHNPGEDGKARTFDLAFVTDSGEVTWEGPWELGGAMAEHIGLTWGGHFKTFQDRPHFEYEEDVYEENYPYRVASAGGPSGTGGSD